MGSREKPLFDLNELPADEGEDINMPNFQPQLEVPSSTATPSNLFSAVNVPQSLVNNHAFSHASTVSGFQPFVRQRSAQETVSAEEIKTRDTGSGIPLASKGVLGEVNTSTSHRHKYFPDIQPVEKEEGEWSDAEGSADVYGNGILSEQSVADSGKLTRDELVDSKVGCTDYSVSMDNIPRNGDKDVSGGHASINCDLQTNNQKNNTGQSSEAVKDDKLIGSQEGSASFPKQRGLKGVEATHALRHANSLGKRPKVDLHKEAMLGKKRSRQTMFLNLEDVKQAGTTKASTPRRPNFPAPVTTRIIREVRITPPAEGIEEKQGQSMNRDSKQVDSSYDEGTCEESNDSKTECNGDVNSGLLGKPQRFNSATDIGIDIHPPSMQRSPWRQPGDAMQPKSSHVPARKPNINSQMSIDSRLSSKKIPSKKQLVASNQYQDTSVERLLREVTNEKMWHHTEESELQSVPGRFESVDEYVRVFEPLLFEECRAQLSSTWEELTETFSRDHTMVRVKGVERRERGWYDVIVLLAGESKWTFKEGDVAVLSTPRPGTAVRSKRDDDDSEVSGRVAGTVRRYTPIDTRDPPGAILHFYVGDLYDSNSKADNDHILRKLQPKGIWFLTVLGSLATTQREYVGLHAFRRLNSQMQNAILQPSPELFPKYEEQSPALPDCITPNFNDHLHRTFNGPQLSAIQWAAMHTAAGTSSGVTKTWPFTLVQGPPGTGKTHTVWGMLNVIHLVQYQHYYTALLKKLAPESYKQVSESNNSLSENAIATGSIDDVLQSMDQNLFRTLPKLCPKPRMLVCAPSNAATDELLARVLDRGFIDGEMKVYRPDVARVGVDSQTRAAQAVSVERRTEQLLVKSRDEIFRWIHELKSREAQLSQQIHSLQRELNVAAAAGRAQGSVGVDPDILVARDQNRDGLLQNLAAVVEAKDKVLVEMSRLLILEGKFRPGWNFNLEEARANLEASFANEAEIVFTTVSSSGRKLFSRLTHGFDMVVIDEAAQASEVAILPPLSLGAARCVLVGDPQQLPATVISKAAGTLLYSRSLFERFQQAGCPTMLLSVQYRMHPQIRDFPSRYFYQGRLSDSDSISSLPDEPYYKDPLLRPYIFYDITHGRESQRGGSVSYQNLHEAQFCFRLYEHLQKSIKSLGLGKVTVGIITPYKLQLKCLQREFESVLNSEEGKDIYINTVDAFQGQERDVIIMSCVRASNHGVGFVADIRRMNVALTRARRSLWVMGNASALMKSEDWAALIKDSKARSCYMDMDALPKDFMTPKAPSANYAPLPSKITPSPHTRSSSFRRSGGMRHRSSMEMLAESSSGTPSEDDEKLNMQPLTSSKNGGSYRSDDLDHHHHHHHQAGDKSNEAGGWQHGTQKKHNSAGPPYTKREL